MESGKRKAIKAISKVSHSVSKKKQITEWIVNDIEDANKLPHSHISSQLIIFIIRWAKRFDIKTEEITVLLEKSD